MTAPRHAETAYLFRHALVRDAAYELQPLSVRQTLHGLAFAILGESQDDAMALDLADHARNGPGALGNAELPWLARAMAHQESNYQLEVAAQIGVRIAAHPLSSREAVADALVRAGRCWGQCGRIAESEHAFGRAESTALELGLVPLRMRCLQGMCNVRRSQGRMQEALALAQQIVDHATQTHDGVLGAAALAAQAQTLVELGEPELACQASQRAVDWLPPGEQLQLRAQVLGNMVAPLQNLKRRAEAELAARQSLAAAEATKSLPHQGYATLSLGDIASRNGDLVASRQHLARAAAIARDTGDRRLAAFVQDHTALLLQRIGDAGTRQAELDAVRMFRELSMDYAQVGLLESIAREELKLGRLVSASEAAELAIEAVGGQGVQRALAPLTTLVRACRLLQNRRGAEAAAGRLEALRGVWERHPSPGTLQAAADAARADSPLGFAPSELSPHERLAALDVCRARGLELPPGLRERLLEETAGVTTPDWQAGLGL